VHWYASVRTHELVAQIDPQYVRARAGRQLFSDLVLPIVSGSHGASLSPC
jgi:hypothetical protein